MAIRAYRIHILSAAFAILAGVLAAPAPAVADEDPQYRPQPRPRVHVQQQRERVRTVVRTVVKPVERVRTVVRVRTRTICYDYNGQAFDCRSPAPVAPQPAYTTTSCGSCAPAAVPVQQYYVPAQVQTYVAAPTYTYQSSCGGCGQTVAVVQPQYYGCGGCGQQAVAPYAWQGQYHRGYYR